MGPSSTTRTTTTTAPHPVRRGGERRCKAAVGGRGGCAQEKQKEQRKSKRARALGKRGGLQVRERKATTAVGTSGLGVSDLLGQGGVAGGVATSEVQNSVAC